MAIAEIRPGLDPVRYNNGYKNDIQSSLSANPVRTEANHLLPAVSDIDSDVEHQIPAHNLNSREIQVLTLFIEGMKPKRIGESLGISKSTAKNYLTQIIHKLGVSNRTEVVVLAIKKGIVNPNNNSSNTSTSEENKKSAPKLGQREAQVLTMVAEGKSTVMIAEALHISSYTVNNHLSHIYRKSGVSSCEDAVVWALKNGMIDPHIDSPEIPVVESPVLQAAQNNSELSDQEIEVLNLVAAGKSNPMIAESLDLDEKDIHNHMIHILHKLGVLSRTEAVVWAMKNGLIHLNNSSSEISGNEQEQNIVHKLSPQEAGVFRMVIEGKSNAMIAESLGISRYTVIDYIKNICDILGITNRADMVIWARNNGAMESTASLRNVSDKDPESSTLIDTAAQVNTDQVPEKIILSKRLVEVLQMVAAGKLNKEIARDLHIKVNTVESHVRKTMSRLHAKSRTEAVVCAVNAGIISV